MIDKPRLRPPAIVMQLDRLGAMHQTPLSFSRSLVRKMMRERWRIEPVLLELDAGGYGTCVYSVNALDERYSVVLFTDRLADDERTDRVIAEKWDITCALVEGEVDAARLAELRLNVPKQEAGRNRPNVLVLSRANKSGRNFNAVVNALANGEQPEADALRRVGYLVRTTAVYGNGKFGVADFAKLRRRKAFGATFAAQMFTVFMIRHFSCELVEYIARQRSSNAVPLAPAIRRYIGVGNATGLGMAPFLVKHPQLIHAWLATREKAIAQIVYDAPVSAEQITRLDQLATRAAQHFTECHTPDARQSANNAILVRELASFRAWLATATPSADLWRNIPADYSLETQEVIHTLLMEVYADMIHELEAETSAREEMTLRPMMTVGELRQTIERKYGWALKISLSEPSSQHLFWYRSAAKEEPRLGQRYSEPGAELEMRIDIGRAVQQLDAELRAYSAGLPIIRFLLDHPQRRGLIRRVQSDIGYGEIQANLLDRATLPIHLLRCKLAMFGASKFDPKSDRWVRITLFQGAPLVSDIGRDTTDDWNFPIFPIPS